MRSLNKYLLILVGCSILLTSCKVLESLGIIEEKQETTQKVIGGKIVKVNPDGKTAPNSNESAKINVGHLVWWVAVFTLIALIVRYFLLNRNE